MRRPQAEATRSEAQAMEGSRFARSARSESGMPLHLEGKPQSGAVNPAETASSDDCGDFNAVLWGE